MGRIDIKEIPTQAELQEMELFFVLRDITHAFLGLNPAFPCSEISRAIRQARTADQASCQLRVNLLPELMDFSIPNS